MIPSMDLVESWKKWYLSMGHSLPSTLTYYSFIKRYVKRQQDITQKSVDKFREIKSNMCFPCSGGLKSFFYYLVRKHNYPEDILNIRFDKIKNIRKMPESLSWDEVQLILNNMSTLKFKVLVLFVFELALRVSEAIKVKWEDFNWSEWLLDKSEYGTVSLKNTKRNKFRKLPVKPKLMSLLYDIAPKTEKGYPYGTVVFDYGIEHYIMNKNQTNDENLLDYITFVTNKFENELKRVGKQYLGKHVHPHILRHSKAQILLDNGMGLETLKEFMGHDDIATTQIYAQASPMKVKRELKEFDVYKHVDLQMLQEKKHVEPFVEIDDTLRSLIYIKV